MGTPEKYPCWSSNQNIIHFSRNINFLILKNICKSKIRLRSRKSTLSIIIHAECVFTVPCITQEDEKVKKETFLSLTYGNFHKKI